MHVIATTSDLLAARQQMAWTLGVHIILASLGVSMPAIMLAANWWGLRRGDQVALTLARRWSKAMAVLFAVGAVTGTVLSFELGLLWPRFMDTYGAAFGVPFAIEGLFFFTEAIFLAIYLFGWKRLRPRAHLWSGVPIVIAGLGGATAVVAANAWMNQPGGYELGPDGRVTEVEPLAVIFNDAWWYEVPHMILAAYCVGGFLIASVYAVGMLRGRRDRYHRLGFLIPFTFATIAIPLQLLAGDTAARAVFDDQPTKFAAMELVTETGDEVPETIGGVLIDGEVRGGIQIPELASLLAGFSTDTEIQGLDAVPVDDQPPANVVHLAFDVMVLAGTALLLMAAWFAFVWWRRRDLPRSKWFLRATATGGALAIIATEAGWIVTEVGRQPWIVYQELRTADAVTTADGLWVSFTVVVVLYVGLAVTAIAVLRHLSRRWRREDEGGLEAEREHAADVPYGPRRSLPAPDAGDGTTEPEQVGS
jgi:cytochrome d ubiquinol oxidase subunit I